MIKSLQTEKNYSFINSNNFFKTILLLAILQFTFFTLKAQTSTEMFETESNENTSFIDFGVTFNIISHNSLFNIQQNTSGKGWSGTANDNVYIDNTSATMVSSSFSIKTTSNLFKVNRFWVYLSDKSLNLNVAGNLTITGKLSGMPKFTQTKNTGFTTTSSTANGYTLIDLTNLNGQNYSNIVIDELHITLGGAFSYARFDAFTWVKDSGLILLPVSLLDFNASAQASSNKLEWKTAAELNNKEFIIYRSGEDKNFVEIGKVSSKGNGNTILDYIFYDNNPLEGNNYYKLIQLDNDGSLQELGVKIVKSNFLPVLSLYPNPVHNVLNYNGELEGEFLIYNSVGKLVKKGNVAQLKSGLNVSDLKVGVYIIKLANSSLKFIKQ